MTTEQLERDAIRYKSELEKANATIQKQAVEIARLENLLSASRASNELERLKTEELNGVTIQASIRQREIIERCAKSERDAVVYNATKELQAELTYLRLVKEAAIVVDELYREDLIDAIDDSVNAALLALDKALLKKGPTK